jgi:hypothetical protein
MYLKGSNILDDFIKGIALISNVFTICASGLAIFLFIYKKDTINSLFDTLINYTYQLSISEIKEKIERLSEYNAKNPEELEKIINILNEVIGQIRGNDKLKHHFSELLKRIESLVTDKRRLTEPRKRAVVSELRERLRHLNITSIDNLVGEYNE